MNPLQGVFYLLRTFVQELKTGNDLIENNRVIVLGVFHCARDPRTVKSKLQDWESSKKT